MEPIRNDRTTPIEAWMDFTFRQMTMRSPAPPDLCRASNGFFWLREHGCYGIVALRCTCGRAHCSGGWYWSEEIKLPYHIA